MYYAMSPDSEQGWYLNTADFARDLQLKWPDAEINYPQRERKFISLEWSFRKNGKVYLTGSFLDEESAITVESEIEDAVAFFLWVRETYSQTKNWIFLVDSGVFIVYLKDRSAEELINLALARTIELRGK